MATRDQQLSAIMTAESGGQNIYNYKYNENPNYYTASGYYQITNTTWKQGAAWAGVDTSQYPTAISAPYSVQTQVANSLIDHVGMSPWSGSKANSYLSQIDAGGSPSLLTSPVDGGGGLSGGSTIAQGDTTNSGFGANGAATDTSATTPLYYNEYDSNGNFVGGVRTPADMTDPTHTLSPVYAGDAGAQAGSSAIGTGTGTTGTGTGTTTTTTSGSGTKTTTGLGAGTGTPVAVGLQSATTSTVTGWINSIETAVGNWMTSFAKAAFGTAANWIERGALIVLAVILIAMALWRLMDPDGEKTKRLASSMAVAV